MKKPYRDPELVLSDDIQTSYGIIELRTYRLQGAESLSVRFNGDFPESVMKRIEGILREESRELFKKGATFHSYDDDDPTKKH